MTAIRTEPFTGANVWDGDTLAADRSWEFELDDGHRRELENALAGVNGRRLALPQITRAVFPLPRLGALLARLTAELRDGRGFALLRGFPVDAHSDTDLERLYWGLCSHIGTGVTQNSDCGFIHYVTDGARRPRQGTRGVGLPQETPLHVDLTDVASLLCVRQAPDDPPSRVSSSAHLYNELLSRRPDALARLYAGFEWGRMGEHEPGETPTSGYRVPFFSESNGQLSCRYNRHWIAAAPDSPSNPRGELENELFDLVDELLREHCYEFPFHRGDVQFCNNYTVMHGRAGHALVDDERRKRPLLRIWLNVPGFRTFTDEAIVRYGIGYHGRLGWTPADIERGQSTRPRPRRADGALEVASVSD